MNNFLNIKKSLSNSNKTELNSLNISKKSRKKDNNDKNYNFNN